MFQINLKNIAVSQTTENFTSMCRFGDYHLGTTSDGLVKICGDSDNGAEIPAVIKSGVFDLGTEKTKGFRAFHFGLEASGDLKLTVFCNGIEAASYTVNKTTGIQEITVYISKAIRGRYLQWQVANVDGSFFALYSVKGLPIIFSR